MADELLDFMSVLIMKFSRFWYFTALYVIIKLYLWIKSVVKTIPTAFVFASQLIIFFFNT